MQILNNMGEIIILMALPIFKVNSGPEFQCQFNVYVGLEI